MVNGAVGGLVQLDTSPELCFHDAAELEQARQLIVFAMELPRTQEIL